MENYKKQCVSDYTNLVPLIRVLSKKIEELVLFLAEKEGLKVHATEARAKTVESFVEKINRPGKVYSNPLKEITDLCGVRVILYYQEDVEQLCDAIRNEFKVDEVNSVNKISELNFDQFGYISNHIICKVNRQRVKLVEWKPYKDFNIEIQVRTVLQHAWASISHTQRYKNEAETPQDISRQLSRVAGLLELADEQFSSLREKTEKLRGKAELSISGNDLSLPIDAISISEFLLNSSVVSKIASYIKPSGFHLIDDTDTVQLTSVCNILDVKNLSHLEENLKAFVVYGAAFFKKFANFYGVSSEHFVSGGMDHWCAVALVANNYTNVNAKKIYVNGIWSESYLMQVQESAKAVIF